MTATTAVALPIGRWCNGSRITQATLRPMTGADQEFLMEAGGAMLPAILTSELLARCVERIGADEHVTPELAGELVTGDREVLLLHLRRITFGDNMDPVVSCPACKKNMDVPLKVTDLLAQPETTPGAMVPEYFEREFPGGERFRFRLPCGADLAAVAPLARQDAAGAAQSLLARCTDKAADELPADALEIIGGWMAQLDPLAEIRLGLSCPECGHAFTSLLDAGAYLLEESMMRSRELYREVHLLAFHYHWSEAEILQMTPPKRKRYLELLLEALG